MKPTKENFGYVNLLHRGLTGDEQFLERLGRLEFAIDHADVFKGHGNGRVDEGREQKCSIGLDIRQRQLSPESGSEGGGFEGNGGVPQVDVIELEIIQFRKHAYEEEKSVWVGGQTLDAERSQAI